MRLFLFLTCLISASLGSANGSTIESIIETDGVTTSPLSSDALPVVIEADTEIPLAAKAFCDLERRELITYVVGMVPWDDLNTYWKFDGHSFVKTENNRSGGSYFANTLDSVTCRKSVTIRSRPIPVLGPENAPFSAL
jgi:hypothetical protein